MIQDREELKEELERMREDKAHARELIHKAREERSEARQQEERLREERDKAREESRKAKEDKEQLESKVALLHERCDRLNRRIRCSDGSYTGLTLISTALRVRGESRRTVVCILKRLRSCFHQ